MLKAVKSVSGKIKILGVTTLTSLNNNDLKKIGYDKNIKKISIKLAKLARLARLDGIICSAHEVKYLKKICKGMDIITPGIRLKGDNFQDQKRIIKTSVENAFRIVVFTNQNKMDLINQFNCNPEKIVIQNLSPFLPHKLNELKQTNFLDVYSKFDFDKNKSWFFYKWK